MIVDTELRVQTKESFDSELSFRVAKLFLDMYSEMQQQNKIIKLKDGGESLWTKQLKMTLGKVQQLVTLHKKNEIIGFAVGMMRITPAYLSQQKTGFISHVYIVPAERKSGHGKGLVQELISWFKLNNADSIELDVLVNNTSGIGFWKKMGFAPELLKMRGYG